MPGVKHQLSPSLATLTLVALTFHLALPLRHRLLVASGVTTGGVQCRAPRGVGGPPRGEPQI